MMERAVACVLLSAILLGVIGAIHGVFLTYPPHAKQSLLVSLLASRSLQATNILFQTFRRFS